MNILEQIIAETKTRVESARVSAPLGALELLPAFRAPTLSLRSSLESKPVSIIAEIKKASPSAGAIAQDFDPAATARSYRTAGAAAISVLTEPAYFGGSLDDLATVRMVVDLPILRKDFVVDAYQVVEARAWGADAILLIAAALDRTQISELMSAATELQMECLVEVHHPGELDKLDLERVNLVGVNNRDLKTFEVDVRNSITVRDLLPTRVTVVSESGLEDARELAGLKRRGIDGFLIGTAFMRAREPGVVLEKMLHETENLLRSRKPLRRVAV